MKYDNELVVSCVLNLLCTLVLTRAHDHLFRDSVGLQSYKKLIYFNLYLLIQLNKQWIKWLCEHFTNTLRMFTCL